MSPYITGYFRDLGYDVNISFFFNIPPFIMVLAIVSVPMGMKFVLSKGSLL